MTELEKKQDANQLMNLEMMDTITGGMGCVACSSSCLSCSVSESNGTTKPTEKPTETPKPTPTKS